MMQGSAQTAPPAPAKPATAEPQFPPEFQSAKIMSLGSAELVRILKSPSSTAFQKAKACQRLAQVGGKEAVPALAEWLGDPQLAHYARFGMVPITDPAVDDALRDALKRLEGMLLVGVINSMGERKDPKSVEPLAKLMYDADLEVARAAAASLGRISGPAAAKALQDGLSKTKGALRTAVGDAGLVCAQEMLAQGDRKGALALYDVLSRPDVPQTVRLAAMHSIIAAEAALNRPRAAAPEAGR